ncbi:MAG: hypothetical protein ACK5HT_10420 [Draconibacterium sp.]
MLKSKICLIVIAIVLCFNLAFILKYREAIGTRKELSPNDEHWKLNAFANYENSNKKLDLTLLLNQTESNNITDMVTYGGRVILFYPNSVCNICDEDIFRFLNTNKNNFLCKNIIALVPIESYRDFTNYNIEYDLGIDDILSYDGEIIADQEHIDRGMFFVIDRNLRISDLFMPNKPLIESDLILYSKKIRHKLGVS